MPGLVAIVLHAHLPYVRHPEHERSIEERWLFEALWECYLPLVSALSRLARRGIAAPISISVSPPLAAMLRDDLLRARFDDHLRRIDNLSYRIESRSSAGDRFGPAIRFYRGRLHEARAAWDALGGDVLGALVEHHRAERVELFTTSASHAYLPGLLASPASVRAQLRLGFRAFASMTGVRPRGLWLPECAYEPALGEDLARAGARYSVLDAHGVMLASPRPPSGIFAPILSPAGVAFFGRDPSAAREVWSRAEGYPGHPLYREFYRDVGFDFPIEELEGEIGPGGARVMTGLKLHRVTGPSPHKEPYDPEAAAALAAAHAEDFVTKRAAALAEAESTRNFASNARGLPPPILVAPFDAELFGHWWLEGPIFLERVLERLGGSGRSAPLGGPSAITLGGYLDRYPDAVIADPAPSSWGEGGFGEAWTGPRSASLFRHMHHASREVSAAVARYRRAESSRPESASPSQSPSPSHGASASEARALAIEQSIRELLLLEASDWAFMVARGEMASYAESRVRVHLARSRRLAMMATATSIRPEDIAWAADVSSRDRFLCELTGPSIVDAFDAWAAPA